MSTVYLPSTSPSGIIALSCVLPVLGIAAVGLRFMLRKRQGVPRGMDDWIMLPALLLYTGMCICAIMGVERRVWGYPTPFEEEESDPVAFANDSIYESQLLEAFQFVQIPTLGCMKLGALLFYRRIFCVRVKRTLFDIFVSIFIGISVLWTIAMLIMNGLQCGSNISALWTTDINIYLEYCVYVFPFETGFAISNFLLDLLIILLPVPKVWSIMTTFGRKVAITAVFALALVGLAGSLARMVSYIQITVGGPSVTGDFRLEDTESIYWSNLEAGLGLLAVNLPTLWGYISKASIGSLVASVRSIISLNSLRSTESSRARRTAIRLPEDAPTSLSNRSDTQMVGHQNYIESHAMGDDDHEQGRLSLPDDGIMVKTTLSRTDEAV